MIINVTYDPSSTASAPAGWKSLIASAVTILDQNIANNITVNIEAFYGVAPTDFGGGSIPANESLGYPYLAGPGGYYSYATIRTDLLASNPILAASLPASDPTSTGHIWLSHAEEKAFGLRSATASAVDGEVAFGTGFTGTSLTATALHEMTHALGRVMQTDSSIYLPFNLFSYSAAGTLQSNGSSYHYFSTDGGNTILNTYNTSSDPADWSAAGSDPFDWAQSGTPSTTLSQVDLRQLQAIGFHLTTHSRDFNGDGMADILWQNSNDGSVAIWQMNGTTPLSETRVNATPGFGWNVIATGDFNGDGKSDILFQNTNDQAAIWLMNGTNLVFDAYVGGNPGPDWKVVGSGDFNGDGNADILWQNTDGSVAIWLMSGTTVLSESRVGGDAGSDWKVIGSGDFNGDGKSDILFQDSAGQAAIWLMNGTTPISEARIDTSPGTDWVVKGAADITGNGNSDILWQNADGTPAAWLMSGTSVLSETRLSSSPGTSWHLAVGTGA